MFNEDLTDRGVCLALFTLAASGISASLVSGFAVGFVEKVH